MSIWDVMQQNALSADEEIELKQHANKLGLIYISTPFSRKAANFLNEIDVPAFKIDLGKRQHSSCESYAEMGRPVIMSTGMQNVDGVRPAVDILRKASIPFALLECSNLYPAPPRLFPSGSES